MGYTGLPVDRSSLTPQCRTTSLNSRMVGHSYKAQFPILWRGPFPEALEECPVRRKWDTRQSSLGGTSIGARIRCHLYRGPYFLVPLFAFAAAFSAFAAE